MKKLFGLALIGLMAGTAGAATTTTTETAVGEPSVYGAVSVQRYDVTVKTTCGSFEIGCKSSSSTSSEFVATIDGDGETRLDAIKIPEDIAVASITYDRKFTLYFDNPRYSTVVFPFSFKTSCIDKTEYGQNQIPFKFYKIVSYNGSSFVAAEETTEIAAHQPYIAKPVLSQGYENGIHYAYMSFANSNGCSYTLKKNYDAETDKFVESKYSFDAGSLNGTWNFMGTYEKIQFTADTKAGVYGFASAEKKDDQGKVVVKAGSFVKAGDNASVPPMRAYLVYNKNGFNKEGKPSPDGETSVASISDEDLPEVITVKFIDKDENGNEEITAIAQMNTRTGEISTDKNLWFDLKGRKLNKKPTVKGTYYNNGQKVIIK
ncbi:MULTISPECIES: hypothetical protein [unclassified Fibrobacter]|uniref:hypothetical protein n=1 Tax=unclassified Fibrobacter TaxID=2634177 RepID=UPI00091A672D|nr:MULTISPECIES: hypothetical protein [unclassified Fibrobacter]OWV06746.1 hypothetical protein B7993_05320 [Fibrobacter sp. UWH3]SHK92781.1 hypothetical protein SAMN05720765_106149 [Fibrobacter sp. UWH6]SHL26018.1 hypothetical protein SAMN05720764_11089 [Fibrobacter sp. UWH5]